MFGLEEEWGLPLAGLAAGYAMGFFGRRHHFCMMSALERRWYANDGNGLRGWILAATVAMIASQALSTLGLIDVRQSFYLSPSFPLIGAVFGGLIFGIGMALVGTCAFGAVVRLGGGNMRAAVVLTGIALAALATQHGLIATLRVPLIDNTALNLGFAGDQSIGSIVSALAGFDLRLPVAVLAAAALLYWIFASSDFRREHGRILAGVVIGLAIAFGWYATCALQKTFMGPVQVEAGSFVAPLGDTLLQIITFTGVLPDYGVGVVVGVFLGAATAAVVADDIRWEACDDARELGRHLLGAFLMGVGGVCAMGCTVGQGISAASLLAVSAPIVMLSIAFGARIGLSILLEGSLAGMAIGLPRGLAGSAATKPPDGNGA